MNELKKVKNAFMVLDFDESKIKRDKDGKFASKGGGSGSSSGVSSGSGSKSKLDQLNKRIKKPEHGEVRKLIESGFKRGDKVRLGTNYSLFNLTKQEGNTWVDEKGEKWSDNDVAAELMGLGSNLSGNNKSAINAVNEKLKMPSSKEINNEIKGLFEAGDRVRLDNGFTKSELTKQPDGTWIDEKGTIWPESDFGAELCYGGSLTKLQGKGKTSPDVKGKLPKKGSVLTAGVTFGTIEDVRNYKKKHGIEGGIIRARKVNIGTEKKPEYVTGYYLADN